MKIEIDISGRIEYASHDTVVAFSNKDRGSILLKKQDKRKIQDIFRQIGKTRSFCLQIFTALIFVLLKNRKNIDKEFVTIDTEYQGWNNDIKSCLVLIFQKHGLRINPDNVNFALIGKRSEAHWTAYKTFKKTRKPDIIISSKELLKIIF